MCFTKHKPHAGCPKSPRQRRMVPSAAEWRSLQRARYNASCSRTDHSFAAGGMHNACFVRSDLDLWPLTLTFKLVRAKDRTRLPCEFGANPFSGSRDIWGTNKKSSQTALKTELHLRAVIKGAVILRSILECFSSVCYKWLRQSFDFILVFLYLRFHLCGRAYMIYLIKATDEWVASSGAITTTPEWRRRVAMSPWWRALMQETVTSNTAHETRNVDFFSAAIALDAANEIQG